MANDVITELVGATERPIQLGSAPASASIVVELPTGPAALAFQPRPEVAAEAPDAAPKVFLSVEKVVGTQQSTSYGVYLNLPAEVEPGRRREYLAGGFPTFGIELASALDNPHGGNGLSASFDITDLLRRQHERGDLDPSSLCVTFIPQGVERELPPVTVGQVGVYYVSAEQTGGRRLVERLRGWLKARQVEATPGAPA